MRLGVLRLGPVGPHDRSTRIGNERVFYRTSAFSSSGTGINDAAVPRALAAGQVRTGFRRRRHFPSLDARSSRHEFPQLPGA